MAGGPGEGFGMSEARYRRWRPKTDDELSPIRGVGPVSRHHAHELVERRGLLDRPCSGAAPEWWTESRGAERTRVVWRRPWLKVIDE